MYYAHSGGHKLPDHLNETAKIAVGMADIGVGAVFARVAGWVGGSRVRKATHD